jgi:single-strand DNA-binding protein
MGAAMTMECAFLGTLGRDAELKTSQAGKPYLRLSVRVGNDDGAQWVSVLAFDSTAVELADRFVKSARIYVEGRLSLNEWTNADGVVKTGLSVMSWHSRACTNRAAKG